jgi:predicted metallopeptidase
MELHRAPDVQKLMRTIVRRVPFEYVRPGQIVCMRSFHAKTRARARIWSFPKIWQMALNEKPWYVIEVVSQYYDRMTMDDKVRVLIHELMHVPKNFSGALVPHRTIHKKINSRTVERLFAQYRENDA